MRQRIPSIVLASALGLGGLATGLVLAPAAASATTGGTTMVGDRLERIGDALSGLVGDGSITQEQADEVATTLDEALPQGRGGPGGHGRGGHGGLSGLDTAATTLGVTGDELRAAVEGGRSLADVAADEGVDKQALVDALVAQAGEHIAAHAEREGLTDGQVAERTAEIRDRVTALVERDGLPLGRGHGGPGRDGDADDGTGAPSPTPSATS